jgi:hypothetical protein
MRVYAGGEYVRETEFIRRHLTDYEIYRHYIYANSTLSLIS